MYLNKILNSIGIDDELVLWKQPFAFWVKKYTPTIVIKTVSVIYVRIIRIILGILSFLTENMKKIIWHKVKRQLQLKHRTKNILLQNLYIETIAIYWTYKSRMNGRKAKWHTTPYMCKSVNIASKKIHSSFRKTKSS